MPLIGRKPTSKKLADLFRYNLEPLHRRMVRPFLMVQSPLRDAHRFSLKKSVVARKRKKK